MTETSSNIVRYRLDSLLAEFDPKNQLSRYFDLLTKENTRINLVSRETSKTWTARSESEPLSGPLPTLAADSLFPLTLIDRDSFPQYLDIGSGGGFPSIPIILSGRTGETTMVERTQKKAAALTRMTSALGCNVSVHPETLEEIKFSGQKFDLITMRLVRLDRRLLKRILSLLADDGCFIYYARPEFAVDSSTRATKTVEYAPETSDKLHTCTVVTKKL